MTVSVPLNKQYKLQIVVFYLGITALSHFCIFICDKLWGLLTCWSNVFSSPLYLMQKNSPKAKIYGLGLTLISD